MRFVRISVAIDFYSFHVFCYNFKNDLGKNFKNDYFKVVQKEWLRPAQRKELSLLKRVQYPEETLRYGDAFLFYDGYNTPAYCFAKLKEKARYG